MAKTQKSDTYAFSVRLSRNLEKALKAEQSRRHLATGTEQTIPGLAAELISEALSRK